ncbi:hypothetical protein [Chitinophaga sp. S165]|uniref:hypothetical protein n=1 Tax=Chitinophaga sp. S165 TaxID=2135462 RepID=UPI000D9EE132|nr:hypothetical protein [Chitinophaga sp. S165]PWV55592.1 hypothetical protein C7475_10198 [Chitinophaga sp. S165]
MKIRLLILCLLTPVFLYSQNSTDFGATMNFLREQGIKLNTVTPPAGFRVYYNCDSLLFMRGNFGDTIKIWTSGSDWYQSLEAFKETIKNQSFGITQFVKSIDDDGRIYVSTYHQTTFIYRKDSLFQIENSTPTLSEPLTQLFGQYFLKRQIDKKTYEARLDSLHEIEKSQAVYIPKLIFAKGMFQTKKEVTLSKDLNFEGDTIELENEWTENGKTCYMVRINNTENGQNTTYAYAIDENMRFIHWEGCTH